MYNLKNKIINTYIHINILNNNDKKIAEQKKAINKYKHIFHEMAFELLTRPAPFDRTAL